MATVKCNLFESSPLQLTLTPTSLKHEIRAEQFCETTARDKFNDENNTLIRIEQSRWQQPIVPFVQKAASCNCRKTQCLKLYCECFAYKTRCGPQCKCQSCCNNQQNDEKRLAAMEAVELRDASLSEGPAVQNPPIRRLKSNKGCSCKKSGCLKKYCECYSMNRKCNKHCVCEGCRNPSEHYFRPTHTKPLTDRELLEEEPSPKKRMKQQRFLSSQQAEQKLTEYLLELPEQHHGSFLHFLLFVLQQ